MGLWLIRGDEVKQKFALIIEELIRPLVDSGQDITVLFTDLQGKD